ncbi:MAG TPA: NDP-sugar synthase [Acidimicrobiales bacterium]|nr:NDP-sugar synthase [Acidimicrobiales bacterium]
MIALVLVGGEGTRLRPLTYDVPKPMLPILERPMIARVVEWLALNGVERVVFSLGYRPDAFFDAFPGDTWAGVALSYAVEPEPLDTGGAIRFAATEAGVEGERLIVVNGDILTDLDVGELVAFHRAHGAEATIALTPVEDPSSYGVVPTTSEGRVLAFIEKPPRAKAPTNLVNAGTYVLEPEVLKRIDAGRRVSVEREVFPLLVAEGVLYAAASDAYWLDTGTPERYLQAHLDILRGARPAVVLPESRLAAPGVRLAAGARHDGESAGDVFLAAGARVLRGALVADSVIGSGALVGAGARVERSLLLPGACVGGGAVVEDSIVGARARLGEGAVVRAQSVLGAGVVVEAGAVLDSARLPV